MAPALLTITPNDPLAGVFLTVPATICSAGREALAPKEIDSSYRRHNNNFIELEVKVATCPSWTPYSSESIGKEGCYCAGWSD